MHEQSGLANHYTAKPVVAGILNIIIGSFYLLGALFIVLGILCYMPVHGSIFNSFPANSAIIAFLVVVPVVSLGILAIFGGIRNLKREKWGWALSGSIAAAIFTIIGVASIVLTALSKDEFTR